MSLNLAVATVPVGLAATTAAFQGTTRPHTILQAVEATRKRKLPSSSSSPIDLVAVVLNVQQHNAEASSSKTPMCRLWICDASLPINSNCTAASCQVLIFGRSKVREIVHRLHVRRGDVMRFNRVHLQSEELNRMNNSMTLYTFKHSYQDPEAGLEYFRLLHIEPDDSNMEILEQQECKNVPESMRTDPDYLRTLIHWYRTSYLDSLPASITGRALPPLPTQYRSLAELQFCQGVVSHVVAFVLHVETTQQQLRPQNIKRRRFSSHGASSTLFSSATTYATLTERKCSNAAFPDSQSGNSVMTLVINHDDCFQHERFQQILNEACDSKRPVRLSHVVSKKCGQSHWSSWSIVAGAGNHQDAGMILQPTDPTKMNLLRETSQDEIQPLLTGVGDEHVAIAAQTLSLSQQQQQQQQQQEDSVLEIMSPLVNIHNAEGVSLQSLLVNRDCLKNDPSPLCKFMRCYPNTEQSPSSWAATVLLQQQDRDNRDGDDDKNKTSNNTGHFNLLHLKASMDGSTLQSLCTGGLDDELLLSPDQARLAVDFVASLVLEQIPLRWTLAVTRIAKTGDGDDYDNATYSPIVEPAHNASTYPPVVYRVLRVSLPRL